MDQALAALGHHTASYKIEFRAGVLYLPHHNLDILFITLNKSEKHFKESTRYEDYAINESLFHWQSKSGTTDKSKTGQRYIQGHRQGAQVILFVREEKSDAYRATETFKCLGIARYSSHEGSAPISTIYKLEEKMPMKLLRTLNKVVDII